MYWSEVRDATELQARTQRYKYVLSKLSARTKDQPPERKSHRDIVQIKSGTSRLNETPHLTS
jgi:hypothetical protein